MANYCDVSDVSDELNGLTINATSTPSSTTVENWISQESELLDRETGRVWGTITVTDEVYDYDGSGSILLNHAPIISITSLKKEVNGINAESESWVSLTEGRTSSGDYYIYNDEGEIIFHGSNQPTAGYKCIKTSYSYGYSTTNPIAKMIVAKRVALRVISTVINGQSSEEGGSIKVDVIELSDPTTFSLDRVKQLKEDIKDLINKLGSFKIYRTNRRYN